MQHTARSPGDTQRRRSASGLVRAVAAVALSWHASATVAQVRVMDSFDIEGAVEAVQGGVVTVRDAAGARREVRVPLPGAEGVPLGDGRLLTWTATVAVRGPLDVAKLSPGQVVRFHADIDAAGKSRSPVAAVTVLDMDTPERGIAAGAEPAAGGSARCTVTAAVQRASRTSLSVLLPSDSMPEGKKTLQIVLAKGVACRLESADVRRIEPGAEIVRLQAVRLNTGDLVVRALEVTNPAAGAVTARGDDALVRKFQRFSDEPRTEPRDVVSKSGFFRFRTDVSDREWKIIEEKLERMATALEKFLGRRRAGVVEGFIVRNLEVFAPGMIDDGYGIEKIRRGEGVCVNSSLGTARRAVLYSCADHGVIQHECVHGFCHVTFGSTGPTWLAEGIAELGNYWRDGDQAVDVPAGVMAYLQRAEPKRTLLEIAVPGRVEAGTWQDYAWRWALCHLLANNPNYSDRFRPLAVALMEERPGVSFESVYGPVAREISFEYDLFLQTVGNGYRSDLAAWPWKARFSTLQAGGRRTATVTARKGWQSSGVRVELGEAYAVSASGTWRTAPAAEFTTADGAADGRGRLVAAVLGETDAGFALGPEQPLGEKSRFVADRPGRLVLRCADDWTKLGDNDGELEITLTVEGAAEAGR